MKYLKRSQIALIASFSLLLFSSNSFAQSVGINSIGAAPDASALLDLNSIDKGFLITRVDTADIVSPAFGLMTLAPKDSCLYIYNGATWKPMGGGGSDCSCNCGTPIGGGSSIDCGTPFADTRDGEIYETLKIGSQCWMRENLNYKPTSGSSGCYNNDINHCNTYGRLYDWNTVTNATSSSTNPSGIQGVCPAGWHVPSDAEWKELEMSLGMLQVEADNMFWRGTNQGDQLRVSSMGGNNSSGFTALPGGCWIVNGGVFGDEGDRGYWWTATESGSDAWYRNLSVGQTGVGRYFISKKNWFSVRCVRN